MEPRIQYAQTADGVSIAFYTLGEILVRTWHLKAGLDSSVCRPYSH